MEGGLYSGGGGVITGSIFLVTGTWAYKWGGELISGRLITGRLQYFFWLRQLFPRIPRVIPNFVELL